MLQAAVRRQSRFQSLTAQLESAADFAAFKDALYRCYVK
jgi:hypothetical protein